MESRLTEEEIELITQRFTEKLQQARSVSDSVHYDHHMWLKKKIEKEEARARLYDELTRHVYKWGIIGVASFVGYAVYLAVKEALAK